MQKILIPTDLSANALRAIKYAAELFKHGRTEIFLLHAYADEVYSQAEDPDTFEDCKAEICRKTEASLEGLKEELWGFSPNPKHNIHCVAAFGMLVDAVNDWVEKENIDLVIMGTKGQTADRNITFGSNTLQVIKYVNCPVLAIPEECALSFPKNILFCTDFLLPYKRREMKLLSNISKRYGAQLHFLYVSDFDNLSLRQQDNKAFLEAVFKENRTQFHQVGGNDITKAVNEFIPKTEVEMLVMVNTRHSYLENILYQSTIEKIGLKINIPFLVMQNLSR